MRLPAWREAAPPGTSLANAMRMASLPSSPYPRGNPALTVRSEVITSTAGGWSPYFEAVRSSPDRTPISPLGFGAYRLFGKDYSDQTARETLAGLSRYIVDNVGLAFYGVDLIANYSTPVIPRGATRDVGWNKAAEAAFDDWAALAEYSGRFDFATTQRLASLAMDMDGDLGVTMDEGHGRPQLRFWPAWRIGTGTMLYSGTEGPNERDGVLIDAEGTVTGYKVMLDRTRNRTFSSDQFLLLVEPEMIERYRGLSPLRRGLNDIRDVQDIKGFEKTASKIESAIAAVIQGAPPLAKDWEDPDMTEEERAAVVGTGARKSLAIADLLGGDIPVIAGELKQFGGNRPAGQKTEFMSWLTGCFISGLGLPPAFYLDEKLTGPNTRGVLGKAQKRIDRRKAVQMVLARWTWLRITAWHIANKVIPPIEGWQRCRYQTPSLMTIDLGDQETADREGVKVGLRSLQKYHGDRNGDWQDETDQVFAEDDYRINKIKEQSKRTGIPLEVLLQKHGFKPPTPKPAPGTPEPGSKQSPAPAATAGIYEPETKTAE